MPLNVCRKKRLNWVILPLRPFNPRPPVTASFRIIKINAVIINAVPIENAYMYITFRSNFETI